MTEPDKKPSEIVAELAESDYKLDDRHGRDKKRKIIIAAIALVGIVVFFVTSGQHNESKRNANNADEEFNTKVFNPPAVLTEEKKAEKPTETLEIPEPPTTTFNVPPPPPPVEVEKKVVEEEFPERFRSKQIIIDNSAKDVDRGSDTTGNGEASANNNKHTAFLNDVSARVEKTVKAKKIERIDAVVAEGTLIPGTLETAINSDLPGQIRAVVSADVYSFDGRRVLIPAGTRLIGEYQSDLMNGQTRVFVVWSRLIRQDGASIALGSQGSDALGRAGMTGHVDKHFRERFSSSILLSIVGGGTSYAIGQRSNRMNYYSNDRDGADEARQTIAQTFSDMANTALRENINIPPTITVDQGASIFVFVHHDLDFSDFYQDPVTEAIKQIKKERGLE